MNEHFMFGVEEEFGEWYAPDMAYPVREANLQPAQPLMDPEETGFGRGARAGEPGEIGTGGSVNSTLHPLRLPILIASMFGARTSAPIEIGDPLATVGYVTKLLPDDEAEMPSFSMQQRYRENLALSFTGCKVGQAEIAAATKQYATANLSIVGKDVGRSGADWLGTGVAAPAVIDPVPYPLVMPPAFKFYQAVMRLGGVPSIVAGGIEVAGGDPRNDFDNIGLTANMNLGEDGYGVNLGDRTRQSIDEGARNVTTRFDPRWNADPAFFDAWLAGEPAVVEMYFRGPEFADGHRYEMTFVLPYVQYDSAPFPGVSRQFGLRRTTVSGIAKVHPEIGVEWGLTVKSPEDLVSLLSPGA